MIINLRWLVCDEDSCFSYLFLCSIYVYVFLFCNFFCVLCLYLSYFYQIISRKIVKKLDLLLFIFFSLFFNYSSTLSLTLCSPLAEWVFSTLLEVSSTLQQGTIYPIYTLFLICFNPFQFLATYIVPRIHFYHVSTYLLNTLAYFIFLPSQKLWPSRDPEE